MQSHLLDRIKSMGEKQKDGDQVLLNGDAVPQPIKRRLLL
jgi:hypothetical protein